ncbi:MAG: phosphate acetyltransferase [Myxococcales bacterium]|nr:phosphate acetyltransferase [Myxococcales bacterium]
MAQTLMIMANEAGVGKSLVSLGLLDQLERAGVRTAYFRPVRTRKDPHTTSLPPTPSMDRPTEHVAFDQDDITAAIHDGRYEEVMDSILEVFSGISTSADVVVCEGVDSVRAFPSLDSDINLDIARSIGARILLVVSGKDRTAAQISEVASVHVQKLQQSNAVVQGVLVNRAAPERRAELADAVRSVLRDESIQLFGVLPYLSALDRPRVSAVAATLGAQVLDGHNQLRTRVEHILVAAMGLENALAHFRRGSLLITPGDREEILLAAAAAYGSAHIPRPSGIVLTGGFEPRRRVLVVARDLTRGALPILRVDTPTYETAIAVSRIETLLDMHDEDTIVTVREAMENFVNIDRLLAERFTQEQRVITPRRFLRDLRERARGHKKTIVLPESEVERILLAVGELRRHDLVKVILLGDRNEIERRAHQLGIELDADVECVNPREDAAFEDYVQTLVELRRHKNLAVQTARDLMCDRNYYGTMMVYKGRADGLVSGATTTTQATIRPAFEFVRTQEGIQHVSSVFFMCLPDRVLVYGDCAVITKPNAEQLAEIAIASAATAEAFGIEPRVAMLSYSTGASGKGTDVDLVREATELVRTRSPHLLVDGPLQYDAAVDPSVAQTKLPNSSVAGRATVLIFPDLNTGNNTYKAVQRSAGAIAIGPVLQGLRKPINDLSRGATVADIVNTVIVTAIQAGSGANR